MSKEWPTTSSPTHPPLAVFYFGRMLGDTPQEVLVTNFSTVWQAGVFVRWLTDDGGISDVEQRLHDVTFVYTVVAERDASGEPMRTRRYYGRLVGAEWDEFLSRSTDWKKSPLPWGEENWRRVASGLPSVSYSEYTGRRGVPGVRDTFEGGSLGGEEGGQEARDGERDVTSRSRREKRLARVSTRSAGGGVRKGADGVITLGAMCAENGVDAGDVRGLLRKRGVEKPDGGWQYIAGDERLGAVADAISAVKRGEKK